MHTTTCTRANSARTAIREMINALLQELGNKTRAHELELRNKLNQSLGIDSLDKKIDELRKRREQLYKERDAQVKLAEKAFAKTLEKRRDRLCVLRSEVLFAKAQRLREMYEELGKP